MRPLDLDFDGLDEYVHRASAGYSFILREHDERTIKQVDFDVPFQKLHFLDLDDDHSLEIIAPFVRHDSLFLRVVDHRGQDEALIFVTDRGPRPTGAAETWDPRIRGLFVADVDGDGSRELLTVVVTELAVAPRGIWYHSLPAGDSTAHILFGAAAESSNIFLDDVDQDGAQEMILATSAPGNTNGIPVGGLHDEESYLALFELTPKLRRIDQESLGPQWTNGKLRQGDLRGNGSTAYLSFTRTHASTPAYAEPLRLIDPATLDVVRQQRQQEPMLDVELVDLDGITGDEILVLTYSGQIDVLNADLEVRYSRSLPAPPSLGGPALFRLRDAMGRGVDLDLDGVDELVARLDRQAVLLGPDLRVKAALPSFRFLDLGVIREGSGTTPSVYVTTETGTDVLRLERNRFYLIRRYGPWVGWLGFVGLVAGLGLLVLQLRRKLREANRLVASLERRLHEARQLIAGLTEHREDEPLDPEDDLTRIFAVVAERYADSRFSVEELAEEIGWSTRKLQRFLKEKIGKTPSEVIWQYRLDRARALFDEYGHGIQVAEVAHAVGFDNANHFSTRFKKAFGITPTHYQDQVTRRRAS